ncbi:MAG: TIGR03862 family flavoprotein [Rhodospirillales bacterium]|nr:TIGR03862 family flavoprotein [Rhodospirillales bacterium]
MVPAPVLVIGAGPAGLMAAETIAAAGHAVMVCDAMPSVGRKLLMAGRGGLNLGNAEPMAALLARYHPPAPTLLRAIEAFPTASLTAWAEGLGQACFTGSSGRIFPRAMKASPLLRAWLARLAGLGVVLRPRHRLLGLEPGPRARIETPDGPALLPARAVVLALGGASWPRLGSDGAWAGWLDVPTRPFAPANCGFLVPWSAPFAARFAGTPLSGIALTAEGMRVRGEAMVSAAGIEGGAVYALARPLREAIATRGAVEIAIDLRPEVTHSALTERLARVRTRESLSNRLRKAASLAPVGVHLLREAGAIPGDDPAALAARIKAVPLRLTAAAPLARAISSAGGIAWAALADDFALPALPGLFAAGEMLDWEAPTGGYLLHACLATGRAAGLGVLRMLAGN